MGLLSAGANGQVGAKLDQKVPKWEFQNMGVGSVLAYLSEIHRQTAKTGFRVQWDQLTAAGTERNTPITGSWPEVRLSTAMELVCRLANSVGAGPRDMDWFVENGEVVVTSTLSMGKRTVRQYPGVTDETVSLLGGFLDPRLGGIGEEPVVVTQDDRLTVNGLPKLHEELSRLLSLCQSGMTPDALGRILGPLKALSGARVSMQNGQQVEAYRWIEFLREVTRVWIVLDFASIERAGLDPRRAVPLNLKDVPGDKALRLLLSEVEGASGDKAGNGRLVVDTIGGEMLMVTTAEAARRHLAAFEITPRIARKLNLPAGDGALELIRKRVDPASDKPVGPAGGEMALVGKNRSRLLCRATVPVLAALAALLEVEVVAPPVPRPRPAQPTSRPAAGPVTRPAAPSQTPASSRPAAETRPARAPGSAPAEAASSEEEAHKKLLLARTYIANKMTSQARAMLRSIIRLYPNTRSAGEAEQELKKLGPDDTD
jgi:hypothetical protein